LYVSIIFIIYPFYLVIFWSSSVLEIIIGIVMILLFYTAYRVSFLSDKGWTVYVSVSVEIAIILLMTLFLGYVYFSLFFAFYIGNIQNKAGFLTLYIVHLATTIPAIGARFFIQSEALFSQLPFIIICVIGVILLPFTI